MPKINKSNTGLTIDDLRRHPSRLVSVNNLAELGLFQSQESVTRAIQSGRLPEPYRAGLHRLWEGRTILKMIGAPLTIPGEFPAAA